MAATDNRFAERCRSPNRWRLQLTSHVLTLRSASVRLDWSVARLSPSFAVGYQEPTTNFSNLMFVSTPRDGF